MPIGDICNREVVTINSEVTGIEAAKLMREHHVGDLVITESRKGKYTPIGLVTDRDIIIEILALGLDASVISAGDIMVPTLATISEKLGVFEAIQFMRGKGVRRLPVTDDHGHLVGIVTMDDLLLLLADELSALTKIITREQQKEVRNRHS